MLHVCELDGNCNCWLKVDFSLVHNFSMLVFVNMGWKNITLKWKLCSSLVSINFMLVCILMESLKVWMDNIEHIFHGMVEYDSQK